MLRPKFHTLLYLFTGVTIGALLILAAFFSVPLRLKDARGNLILSLFRDKANKSCEKIVHKVPRTPPWLMDSPQTICKDQVESRRQNISVPTNVRPSQKNTTGPTPGDFRRIPIISECVPKRRWVVITSIAEKQTKAMLAVLRAGWCLVVVGDRKSPAKFRKSDDPRFVYLDLEAQRKLPFTIVPMTPENHFARKNIGYLYAMSQGAQVIADLDDDNEPISIRRFDAILPVFQAKDTYQRPLLHKEELGDVPDDRPVWNPYPFFNLPNAWPRGFPTIHLDKESQNASGKITVPQRCKPIIQQYLANLDPDVDATYRIKYPPPGDYRTKDFRTLVLPRNVFSPYNAQATIHMKDSFWSMLLPASVDGRVADIWRSYISQSLLHLIPDACIMFTSPAVRHVRNFHNHTDDFLREIPLYENAAAFIELTRNLPIRARDFQAAFLRVYEVLTKRGLIKREDAAYAETWIHDLNEIGYSWPRMPGENSWTKKAQLCVMFNNRSIATITAKEIAAKYLPLFDKMHLIIDSSPGMLEILRRKNTSRESSGHRDLDDLLTTSNWPPDLTHEPCPSYTGYQQNRCLHKCLQKSGGRPLVYMADDDFLNFANATRYLSTDKIWFQTITHHRPGNGTANAEDEDVFRNYWGWNHKDQLVLATQVLKSLPLELKRDYLRHVAESGELEGHAISDFVFVPPRFHAKLKLILEMVDKLAPNINSEAGMPLVMNLVAPGTAKQNVLPNVYLWDTLVYNTTVHREWIPKSALLHPLKTSIPSLRAVWRDAMADQYNALS